MITLYLEAIFIVSSVDDIDGNSFRGCVRVGALDDDYFGRLWVIGTLYSASLLTSDSIFSFVSVAQEDYFYYYYTIYLIP